MNTPDPSPSRSTAPLDADAVAMGARIRSLRRAAGLTLIRLAAVTGMSQPFLSLVERGHARLSLASMSRLAEALDVPPGSLLARPATERVTGDGVDVVRADHDRADGGRTGAGRSGELTVWQLAQLPGGLFATELVGQPARDGAPARPGFAEFTSHDEEEFLYLLDGTLEVVLADGASHLLRRGDTLALAAGVSHAWRAVDASGFRVVAVTSGRHSH